jgi:hypothetical protein
MKHVKNIQYGYLLKKYLKCSVWRLAVRYDIYIYETFGGKGLYLLVDHLLVLACIRGSVFFVRIS